MAFACTIKDQLGLHFVTFTVHQWADVFTRRDCSDILINSLKFCRKEKGLMILESKILTYLKFWMPCGTSRIAVNQKQVPTFDTNSQQHKCQQITLETSSEN